MTRLVMFGAVLLGLASPAGSADTLRMSVSPQMTVEPAMIVVRMSVEPDDTNRGIRIVAESENYYRSSEVMLDGSRAARTNVFQYRDLPAGRYRVRGSLIDESGDQRAFVDRQVLVLQ